MFVAIPVGTAAAVVAATGAIILAAIGVIASLIILLFNV